MTIQNVTGSRLEPLLFVFGNDATQATSGGAGGGFWGAAAVAAPRAALTADGRATFDAARAALAAGAERVTQVVSLAPPVGGHGTLVLQRFHATVFGSIQAHGDPTTRGALEAASLVASGFIHEVNNPLSLVLSNSDFLGGELNDLAAAVADHSVAGFDAPRMAELVTVVKEIDEAVARMRHTVSNYQSYTRMRGEHAQWIDPTTLLKRALELLKAPVRSRMRFVLEENRDASIHVDVSRLLRAVTTLLLTLSFRVPTGGASEHATHISTQVLPSGATEILFRATGEPFPDAPFSPVHGYAPLGSDRPVLSLATVQEDIDGLGATLEFTRKGAETWVTLRFLPPSA